MTTSVPSHRVLHSSNDIFNTDPNVVGLQISTEFSLGQDSMKKRICLTVFREVKTFFKDESCGICFQKALEDRKHKRSSVKMTRTRVLKVRTFVNFENPEQSLYYYYQTVLINL